MSQLPPLRIPRCLIDPAVPLPPADREGLVLVSLEHGEGKIRAIRPAETTAASAADDASLTPIPWTTAARRNPSTPGPDPIQPPLALTPLVDAHVHLDKAWSADAFPNPAGTMDGALAANLAEIALRTPEAVLERGERALELAWRHGCRALRSHVDSLGPAAAGGWEALLTLRQRWSDRLDLQLVAMAPLIHWASPEGEAQARRVVAAGGLLGAVVGPPFARRSYDRGQLNALLRLADRLGAGIDLHIDESDRLPGLGLRQLAGLLERQPCSVPITCSHASSMALLADRPLARLADRLAALEVAVVALPFTNLWLLGKREGHTPWRRPQAPLQQLQAAGVTVAVASDNVRDPWYPGGDFDPLELLRLAPLLSQQRPWQRRGLAPFCSGASRLLDLAWDGVLRVGSPADLVVLSCTSWGELLARTPRRRVLRAGRWLPPPPADASAGPHTALASLGSEAP
jgi:cytosine deaminase